MNCIACGQLAQPVIAMGYLHSPPVFVHHCKASGSKFYTTDGSYWAVNQLPGEVVFRATNAPESGKGSQALTARVLHLPAATAQPTGNEGA
jgi:hypothetical protein